MRRAGLFYMGGVALAMLSLYLTLKWGYPAEFESFAAVVTWTWAALNAAPILLPSLASALGLPAAWSPS